MLSRLRLKKDEEAVFRLRDLYQNYGYSQYKMSKFEEYDLYVRNKDFLISDGILTFTDTNGKLMALKPDVTLSILKNFHFRPNFVQKTFYHENVYRVSAGTGSFREIVQVGIECLGSVDDYAILEVLSLAAKSLTLLSENFVLEISHFGLLMELIEAFGVSEEGKKAILSAVGEKNLHELSHLCKKLGLSEREEESLSCLLRSYGSPREVLPALKKAFPDEKSASYLASLTSVCARLEAEGFSEQIRIDFSVVNEAKYYNGIIFKGFVKGIPTRVLSGGQYDRLVQETAPAARAIGFAVYMDLFEDLFANRSAYDGDCILLYDSKDAPDRVAAAVEELIQKGKRVTAQVAIPDKITYRECYRLASKGVEYVEGNA